MRAALVGVLSLVTIGVVACGSATTAPSGPSPTADRAARRLLAERPQVLPAPGPTGRHAGSAAVSVIRAWSDALRTGHIRTAAEYFTVPSEMINGVGPGGTVAVLSIASLRDAEQANETLPCGARLISADQRGPYVNALFRLTGRSGPGGNGCPGGTGQTARTNFLIADGRIVEWIRAPDDPGDNGSGGGGSPAAPGGGGSPGAPGGGGSPGGAGAGGGPSV